MENGFAVYDTILGYIRITYEDTYITSIEKLPSLVKDMGTRNILTDKVNNQLVEYFNGSRKSFDFPYKLKGTEFQQKVWKALCSIPYGETRSYKEIATLVGNEKASRAVGMANNKNPLSIVVPCHRVIGSNGKLVGYASGLDMKIFLIDLEKKFK